jgi:hypothetical protein
MVPVPRARVPPAPPAPEVLGSLVAQTLSNASDKPPPTVSDFPVGQIIKFFYKIDPLPLGFISRSWNPVSFIEPPPSVFYINSIFLMFFDVFMYFWFFDVLCLLSFYLLFFCFLLWFGWVGLLGLVVGLGCWVGLLGWVVGLGWVVVGLVI